MTSVLPPTSDVSGPDREVAKVPLADKTVQAASLLVGPFYDL